MTLTHDEIAAMTCGQVNKEIAKRLDQYEEWDSMGSDNMDCPDVFEEYPDYCHDWSYAGRLLEEMATQMVSAHPTLWRNHNEWVCQAWCTDASRTVAIQSSHIAPEAIARCWLEWWEVTHE